VRYLAAAATDRGADFREGLRVLSLEQRPDGSYEVITAEGVVNAKKVVLAAGAAIPGIARGLGAKVPIIGGGGYSVDIELEPEPILPLLFHEHRVAVNSIGGRTRVAGLMEIGKSMPAVNRRKADYLLRTSQEVFPNAQIFNPGPVWSGIRPCTPDGVPIIGQVPGHDNVIVAGGHAMVGITLSAGTGRLVADLVDEQPLQIAPAAFAIDRF
jgi:D-amino-acid dehydrogenase